MMCSAWRPHLGACWAAVVGTVCLGWGEAASGQETCLSATPVTIGAALMGSNAAAQTDTQSGMCTATSHDVWHTFVPTISGAHTIALCGSSFDTVLALYDDCGHDPLICDDDSCGLQSQVVLTLNAGQAYWVRIGAKGSASPGGSYRLTVTGPATSPPPNNSCGAPTTLIPNQWMSGTTAGATGTDLTPGCGTLDRADVWFNFAPRANGLHIIELCSTAFDTVLSVHNSCVFSTPAACNDDAGFSACGGVGSRLVFNATVGQPFLVRVAGTNDSFGPFEIRLFTAQANDLCANAAILQTNVPVTGAVTPAVGTEVAETCVPSASDVWYSYVATVTSPHTFSTCNTDFDTVVSVFSACPGTAGFTEIGCDDNGCSGFNGLASRVVVDLTVGQIYYVRVAGRLNGSELSSGTFSLLAEVTPPSNDLCANAMPLTLGVPVSARTSGASGMDMTPCGDNDSIDVWYSFVPPSAGMFEFSTCGSVINTTLGLFASCASLIDCSDDAPGLCGTGSHGAQITAELSPGTTYYLRVAGVGGTMGRYRLVANRVPPANDGCGSAQFLSVGVAAAGTLTGATGSGVSSCGQAANADVYYAFTAPETRAYQIDTCGSTARTAIGLYTACPPGAGAAELQCAAQDAGQCGGTGGSAITPVLRAGTGYRIRVSLLDGAAPGPFQVLVSPATPRNDDCLQATELPLNAVVLGTNRGATGGDITPCGLNDTADVWFGFVPDLSGTYEFSTCAEGSPALDTTIAVFDDCPGNPFASGVPIACNDDDPAPTGACPGLPRLSRVTARLDAGRLTLVRVAGTFGAQGAFGVLARYARPANDNCSGAQAVGNGTFPYDTLGADSDPITADSSCGLPINPLLYDVWFRYTAAISGPVIASVCGSTFDTAMTASLANACTAGPMPVLACNDDYDCDGNPATPESQSRVSFIATAGQAYLVRIGSASGQRGAGELRISQPGLGCPCDWNHSGELSLQDLFDFLGAWFANAGDFNGSGQTTIGDIFDFLACYLGIPPGCG